MRKRHKEPSSCRAFAGAGHATLAAMAVLFVVYTRPCRAQAAGYSDLWDQNTTTEFKTATIVTNLWLAAFAVCSAVYGILGAVVAVQWPNPRILCYKTSYSDMPSSSTRTCCSLYSLNLALCVFWLLVFAIMVIARDVIRIVMCLCFCIVHTSVVIVFRMKFKKFGRPERSYNNDVFPSSGSVTGLSGLGPRPAVGVPIYNIPMQTVVIGGPAADSHQPPGAGGTAAAAAGGATAAAGAPNSSNCSWYDAACLQPPQQQGSMFAMAPGSAATGPFAMPLPGSSSLAPTYPPQPASAYNSMYSRSPYPSMILQQQQQQQAVSPEQTIGATVGDVVAPAGAGAAAGVVLGLPAIGTPVPASQSAAAAAAGLNATAAAAAAAAPSRSTVTGPGAAAAPL